MYHHEGGKVRGRKESEREEGKGRERERDGGRGMEREREKERERETDRQRETERETERDRERDRERERERQRERDRARETERERRNLTFTKKLLVCVNMHHCAGTLVHTHRPCSRTRADFKFKMRASLEELDVVLIAESLH